MTEILNRSNPRHIANAGSGGGGEPVVNLRNINLFDASDLLTKALGTTIGERVMFNFVQDNAGAIRRMLND